MLLCEVGLLDIKNSVTLQEGITSTFGLLLNRQFSELVRREFLTVEKITEIPEDDRQRLCSLEDTGAKFIRLLQRAEDRIYS